MREHIGGFIIAPVGGAVIGPLRAAVDPGAGVAVRSDNVRWDGGSLRIVPGVVALGVEPPGAGVVIGGVARGAGVGVVRVPVVGAGAGIGAVCGGAVGRVGGIAARGAGVDVASPSPGVIGPSSSSGIGIVGSGCDSVGGGLVGVVCAIDGAAAALPSSKTVRARHFITGIL